MANFVCGAARDLPIATDETWDGAAAKASIFEWAGFNGDHPDPGKAKKGFLVYDSSAPTLKGSYKLPFALVSGGTLKASPAGVRAAASRLPQTDGLSSSEQDKARAIIDHYEGRMNPDHQNALPPVLHKRLEGDPKIKALQPSETDLDLINKQTPAPVDANDVVVLGMRLANDQLDRSNERFPVSYLDRFAQTIPGKSLMIGHDYKQGPVGRFISGEVRPDDLGNHLYAKAYVAADSQMAKDVRLGIAKDVSIGFTPDTLKCDICQLNYTGANENGAYCPHIQGRSYDGRLCTLTYGGDTSPTGPVEALEGSSVWLGCQRGAEMDTARQMAALHARKAAWVDAHAAKQPREKREEDMDEIKELQAEVARLTPLAAAGEEYLKHLRAEVVRKAGILELGEAYTELASGADTQQLIKINATLDKKVAAELAPTPGAHVGDGNVEQPAVTRRSSPHAPRRRGS